MRLGLLRVLACLGAVGVALIFEGPLGNWMQQARQRHLAAQFLQVGKVRPGQAEALLQIGKIHLNVVVIEGDSPADLRSGPGHRIGTASPGLPGEALIVGLRSGYHAPFARLGELVAGDTIVMQDRNGSGRPLGFVVTETERLSAPAVGPPPGSEPILTLDTGTPQGSNRIIVRAKLVAYTPIRGARPPAPPTIVPRRGYYSGGQPDLVHSAAPIFWLLVTAAVVVGAPIALEGYPAPIVAAIIIPVEVFALLEVLLAMDCLLPGRR